MDTAFWILGEKAAVAKSANIRLTYFYDIISGRRRVSTRRARELEASTLRVLGPHRVVPASAWLRLAPHPALKETKEEMATAR